MLALKIFIIAGFCYISFIIILRYLTKRVEEAHRRLSLKVYAEVHKSIESLKNLIESISIIKPYISYKEYIIKKIITNTFIDNFIKITKKFSFYKELKIDSDIKELLKFKHSKL